MPFCNFVCTLQPSEIDEVNKTPETETPAALEVEVNKPPKQKPWVSLGSENEIEAESVKETRPRVLQYIETILNTHAI